MLLKSETTNIRNPNMYKYILIKINDIEHKLLGVQSIYKLNDIINMQTLVYPDSRYDVNISELDIRTHHNLLNKLSAIEFINEHNFVKAKTDDITETIQIFANVINMIDNPNVTNNNDTYLSTNNYFYSKNNDPISELEKAEFYIYIQQQINNMTNPKQYWDNVRDAIYNDTSDNFEYEWPSYVVESIWNDLNIDNYISKSIQITINTRYNEYKKYIWSQYIKTYGEKFLKEDGIYYDVGTIKKLEYTNINTVNTTTKLTNAYNNGLSMYNDIVLYFNKEFENYGFINKTESGMTDETISINFPEIEIIGSYMLTPSIDIFSKIDELCNSAYDTLMLNKDIEKLIHETQNANNEVSFSNLKLVIENNYTLNDDRKKCVRFNDILDMVCGICNYTKDTIKRNKVMKILPSVLYSMKLRKKRLASGVHWYGMELIQKTDTTESPPNKQSVTKDVWLSDIYKHNIKETAAPCQSQNNFLVGTPVTLDEINNIINIRDKEYKNIKLNILVNNTISFDDYNKQQNIYIHNALTKKHPSCL